MNKTLHPLCEIFPRLPGAELKDLAGDIKLHGLRQPITLLDGMILDGGNRYAACVYAGIEPRFAEYEGDNPAAFVLSMNLHRRHLPIGQYATIVSLAQDWTKAQPASRPEKAGNVAGLRDQGAPLPDLNAATEKVPLRTVADRATQSGASDRTQRMADKIAKAAPELAKQVAHGEISLPQAVRQVEQKPKPAKVAAPAVAPDPEEGIAEVLAETVADLEREVAENRSLQERVVVLTAADQVAKLNEWITKFHKLDAHLTQVNTTLSEAQKEATRKGKRLAEIRAFLGVERDSEILPKLKGGA